MNNRRGTLLVSGYRGVGKTTSLKKALSELNEACLININLSCMMSLRELASLLLREIAKIIDPEICELDLLNLGYKRKLSWSGRIKQNSAISDNPLMLAISSLLTRLHSRFQRNFHDAKRSLGASAFGGGGASFGMGESGNDTFEFFDITDAELVQRLRDVINKFVVEKGKKLIFSFDEIDKLKGFRTDLENQEEKITQFEDLIGKLKPILVETTATYVFVVGRETYYRWQMDKSRGLSVYSSVFDKVIEVTPFLAGYVRGHSVDPNEEASGDATEKIKNILTKYIEEKFVPNGTVKDAFQRFFNADIIKSFLRYLLWKSRGLPRRIIHEFEQFVITDDNVCYLYFDTIGIRRLKFYSGIVKELYHKIVWRESLDSDGILNLIILSEALFKFHRVGFNYADLKYLTVGVDQDVVASNEHYYNLAIGHLDGWWVERNYGRKANYVFQPHIKAAIRLLSEQCPDEAVAFTLVEKDFKNVLDYFLSQDKRIESQPEGQRISSIRVQVQLGKIMALLGRYFEAIEYYKKAARLGIYELQRETNNAVCVGNTRVLTRLMADSYLDIGHLLERKRRLREAMAFYTSGFYISYKSHQVHESELRFDLKGITGNIIKEPVDEYFAVGEEAIDGLTHIGYIQWKYGELDAALVLFKDALEISRQRNNPHKIASQIVVLGFFLNRIGEIDKAYDCFGEIAGEVGHSSPISSTPLPAYIVNSAHEGQACCKLAQGDLHTAIIHLDRTFERLDMFDNQRRILDIMILKLRIQELQWRKKLPATPDPTIRIDTELKAYCRTAEEFFEIIRSRNDCLSDGCSYRSGLPQPEQKEQIVSIRQYFHFVGMFCWSLHTLLESFFEKKEGVGDQHGHFELQADMPPWDKAKSYITTITNDCRPLLTSIINKIHSSVSKSSKEISDSECLSDTKRKDQTVSNCVTDLGELDKMVTEWKTKINTQDGEPFADLENIYLFLEQAFLLCHRSMHKHVWRLVKFRTWPYIGSWRWKESVVRDAVRMKGTSCPTVAGSAAIAG